MSRPSAGQVQQVESLYQRYMTTGSLSDARAWMDAAQAEAVLRYSKISPPGLTEAEEWRRNQSARVDPHRCRRCGGDTIRAFWCDGCAGK